MKLRLIAAVIYSVTKVWVSMAMSSSFYDCYCVCVYFTGASDSHSRVRRRFPRHGGVFGRYEGPVWVRGPRLYHIYCWPLWIHMVCFYFTSSLFPLHPASVWPISKDTFSFLHIFCHCYVSLSFYFLILPRCCSSLLWQTFHPSPAGMKSSSRHLWLISVSTT